MSKMHKFPLQSMQPPCYDNCSDWMPFVSPSWQCQSTKGTSAPEITDTYSYTEFINKIKKIWKQIWNGCEL